MKLLTHLPAWLKNKYFISFAAFTTIMLFLDKNDFFTQRARKNELKNLEQGKAFYTREIETERKELEQLKRDPATLEKYAREKYFMKKDNEELFIITGKPEGGKN